MAGLGNERGMELNAHARGAGCDLMVTVETWPIRGGFTISRGAKHEAVVVVASLSDGRHKGRGECVPYARYGERVEDVVSAIAACAEPLAAGLSRAELASLLPAGAARNAVSAETVGIDNIIAGAADEAEVTCSGALPNFNVRDSVVADIGTCDRSRCQIDGGKRVVLIVAVDKNPVGSGAPVKGVVASASKEDIVAPAGIYLVVAVPVVNIIKAGCP